MTKATNQGNPTVGRFKVCFSRCRTMSTSMIHSLEADEFYVKAIRPKFACGVGRVLKVEGGSWQAVGVGVPTPGHNKLRWFDSKKEAGAWLVEEWLSDDGMCFA